MPAIPVTVIGYGSSSRTFHLPLLRSLPDLFQLYSIQQRPSSSSGPRADHDYPGLLVHASIEDVFSGPQRLPKGGLAIVTITNALHVSTAKTALEAGCHVVVEKPMGLQSAEIEELDRLAKSKGLVCTAFHNRRFDNDYLFLKSLASGLSSPIGEIVSLRSHFDRYRPVAKGGWREDTPPEKGGGLLWDLGSHLVDQALTLFGPPTSLYCRTANQRSQQPPAVDDFFELQLYYDTPSATSPLPFPESTKLGSGPTISLSASVLSALNPANQPRFEVHGTLGSWIRTGVDPQENQLKAGQSPASHPQTFGTHELTQPEQDADDAFGWLTTAVGGGVAQSAIARGTIPELTRSKVPLPKGSYIDYYIQVGAVVGALYGLHAGDAPAAESVVAAALEKLPVKASEVALATKVLEVARVSAAERRVVTFDGK